MGTYKWRDVNRGLIPAHCPNYREKSKGLLKGCDRICSCTGTVIDRAYASSVCLFYKTTGDVACIKYDECSNYKKFGIRNSR